MTTLYEGDALEFLNSLPDKSVDLIVTDPPYYRVKAEWWDRQWDTQAGFLAWIDKLAEQWARVLRYDGSLYCFASPQMAAHVEVTISRRLNVLAGIVWQKDFAWYQANDRFKPARCSVSSLRSWYQSSERIIFAEQFDSDNIARCDLGYEGKNPALNAFIFEPLRAYLVQEMVDAGLTREDVDAAWQAFRNSKGVMSPHWFGASQWTLPTEKNYLWLRNLFNSRGSRLYLQREYSDLQEEFAVLQKQYEDLRRPFSVTAEQTFTDVWTYPTVAASRSKHPCEKPEELIRHIIRTSSRPGAAVLDNFMGSGVVGEVALQEGRVFLGSEIDPVWFNRAKARIAGART